MPYGRGIFPETVICHSERSEESQIPIQKQQLRSFVKPQDDRMKVFLKPTVVILNEVKNPTTALSIHAVTSVIFCKHTRICHSETVPKNRTTALSIHAVALVIFCKHTRICHSEAVPKNRKFRYGNTFLS